MFTTLNHAQMDSHDDDRGIVSQWAISKTDEEYLSQDEVEGKGV